jgi:peptide/nickel transport system substrate-binding protein
MTTKIRRRLAGGAALVAALCLVPVLATAQELKLGLKSEPTAMDPQFHALTTNIQIVQHVFEGLVAIGADLQLRPQLALSWQNISDKVWEFKLRPGVKFSDGSNFSADDVVFTIDRIAKVPNSPAPFTLYSKEIERVEVVDPLTVRLHTKTVRPSLPQDMVYVLIMSRKAASGPNPEGVSTAELNQGKGLIGTGAFKFVSWSRGAEIVLERNDGYWGARPHWQKVVLRPISNPAARVSALLSGSVDLIEDPPPDDLVRLRKDTRLHIAEIDSLRLIYIGLYQSAQKPDGLSGTNGANPFQDVRVRRALSEALDRPVLAERVMEGVALPTADLVLPRMPGARPEAQTARYDPAHARQLLAEAGYPNGFTMSLGSPNGRYINDLKVAQAIASMWGRIGIKTQVEAATPALFFKRAADQGYSGYMIGWGDSETSSRQRALLATHDPERGLGAGNHARYSSPEVDRLIEQAGSTLDRSQREALQAQASAKALDEDVALIPLYFERSSWGMRKGLRYAARPDQQLWAQHVTPVAAD